MEKNLDVLIYETSSNIRKAPPDVIFGGPNKVPTSIIKQLYLQKNFIE